MYLLRYSDFLGQIQDEDLDTILQQDDNLLWDTMLMAQSEMEDYLRHRYLVAEVFKPLYTWAPRDFKEGDRAELFASAWSDDKRYRSEGLNYFADMVEHQGSVYYALKDSYKEEPGKTSAWRVLCDKGQIFTAHQDTSRPPYDASAWAPKDTRHPRMKVYLVDITLYHLHSRVAPRAIPEHRIVRYEQAVQNLKKLSKGEIDSDLPERPSPEGRTMRWGNSSTRLNHYF